MELALEKQKLEMERELEQRKIEAEKELEMEKLRLEKENLQQTKKKNKKIEILVLLLKTEKLKYFYVTKHIRFVPAFQEKEVDKYFLLFEKVAKDLDWPLDKYTILLQSVLKGKASEVYLALKPEQTSDYHVVKETILKAYELIPEAYRQKFRNFKKETDKTHVEFAREKERLFDRWCMSEKIDGKFENLKEMILLEEFKNCVHPSIKNHITEHKAQTLQKASEMADEFFLSHRHIFQKSSQGSTFRKKFLLREEYFSF